MPHKIYDNFYLSNEVEDQFNSHLNLMQFCNVDNSLVGEYGMLRKINVYSATDGTEILAMGEGNTKTIEVSYRPEEYRIKMAQNHFEYKDEEAMTDPMLVPVGCRHMGTDLFNTTNADVYKEFKKATQVVPTATFGFNAFVDAQSMFRTENLQNVEMFAFVSPADTADLRKELKDSLQYVEAFVRNGYIGTVAGVNLYTKLDATPGEIIVATKDAVTYFNKKGVEIEVPARSKDEANIRSNNIFSRKYYLVALTNEGCCVKIVKKASAAITADTTVQAEKVYYKQVGNGYVAIKPTTANPKTEGLFEIK